MYVILHIFLYSPLLLPERKILKDYDDSSLRNGIKFCKQADFFLHAFIVQLRMDKTPPVEGPCGPIVWKHSLRKKQRWGHCHTWPVRWKVWITQSSSSSLPQEGASKEFPSMMTHFKWFWHLPFLFTITTVIL